MFLLTLLQLLNILLLQDLYASDHSFGDLNNKVQCLMAIHFKGYNVNGQVVVMDTKHRDLAQSSAAPRLFTPKVM